MRTNTVLAVVGACLQAANAAPPVAGYPEMRLVKTSAQDPGQWVTEQEKFDRFTSKNIGFIDITDIKDKDVLAALSTADEQIAVKRAVAYPEGAQHQDQANGFISKANTNGPKSWLKTFSDFNTRHYQSATGTQASKWLFDQVKSIASSNPAITVQQVQHRFNQPSVIARIPGTTSNLVIVGAHLDSTGGNSQARSPGADDNGSGTVTHLEAFRVLVAGGFKPKNTLEFHWYAGEEGGLLGSADIFASYRSSRKTVLAMLNQDMTGYSPSGRVAIYSDNVDQPLTTYVRALAREYTGTEPLTSRCGYGCSDHASARSNGFPSAFANEDLFEKSNPNIHSSRDSYEKVQWDAVLRHTKLAIGFLVEASYL
ncbi:hypothetical protein PWT90_04652 [Aphanocladium album]|nr:hypothetical protein PWT90_04652 [Aphanocladium album]